MSWNNKEETGK